MMTIVVTDGIAQKGVDVLRGVPEFEVEVRPALSSIELKETVCDVDATMIRSAT